MAKWTPILIQGGKTDDVPSMHPEAEAFLRAFIEAGIQEQAYGHISFMNIEPHGQTAVSSEIPKATFGMDELGAPVIRFF